MHESVLVYRNLRYLKWAIALAVVSGLAYAVDRPMGAPNGATWLGYTLGTVAAGLMIWLAWFGVRKRRYGGGALSVQEWLSAHVYLGLALVVIATLHAGFHLGLNIHAAVYILMLVVVISGVGGIYFYMRYPTLLTQNRGGLTFEVMLAQIADLDREMRQLAIGMDNATNAIILRAAQDTVIGGNLFQQLRGHDRNCPTTQARLYVEQGGPPEATGAGTDNMRRQLLARLVRKEDLLRRIRRDVQLRCLLKIWLYVHVPFALATLAALVVHVVTEFYYW